MWSRILELEGSLKSEVGLGEVVCTGAAGEGLKKKGKGIILADLPRKRLLWHEDLLRGLGTLP